MKKFIIIFFVTSGYSQSITSKNYKTILSGTWTVSYSDSLWKIEDWRCVDTIVINSNGIINSVRTCKKPEDFPDDEEFDPILLGKEMWTRFDTKKMKIYYKHYQEWDNTWSKEIYVNRVISIHKDEIKVEVDAYLEGVREKKILYVIYRRVG
jgi:hypothetical protein